MKLTIISIVLAVLCNLGLAWGAKFQNPDVCPSIGVDITETHTSLNLSEAYAVGNTLYLEHGNDPVTFQQVTFDFRSPLTNYVTFDLHGGPNTLTGLGEQEKGYAVGASLRVYLPQLQ